mgnify:CR=1 FL=1|tara:strand:+ start:705 stop:917 length:213 start_codon:yes stop_codon:yes gene_type:complete
MRDVSKIPLLNTEGEITPQGIHLCRAYGRALEMKNEMMRTMLISVVENQYKQPSFVAHFREIDNDPTLYL